MRQQLAQLPFEEKIRKVGELIRLRQKIKTGVSKVLEEAALLALLDKAAAELDAGKGVPIERVRKISVSGRGIRRNETPKFATNSRANSPSLSARSLFAPLEHPRRFHPIRPGRECRRRTAPA